MNNVLIKKEKEKISLEILGLSCYEDFDIIIRYLKKYFNANDTNTLDGPDMRVCNLTISDIDFELYNDPYGNVLSSSYSLDSQKIIENIAKDLDARLSS